MARYCTECGAELADAADFCTECGTSTDGDDASAMHDVLSYFGSMIILLFALVSIAPVEGYQQWYVSFVIFAATGIATLPPVKDWLKENQDIVLDRGSSWATSIVGFMMGLYAIPT